MDLCRVTRLLFWFYKIVGLATFSINKKTHVKKETCSKNVLLFVNSKLGILYNFLLSCFIIVHNYTMIPLIKDSKYPYKTTFTVATEIFQALLGCFVTCFILLYFCLKQAAFIRTGNRLIIAADIMCRLQQSSNQTYPLSLIIVYFFNLILLVILYISEMLITTASVWFFIGTIVPAGFLSLFYIQYFTMLAILNEFFVVINRIMKETQSSSVDDFTMKIFSQNRRLFLSSFTIQLLVQIRELHGYLCDVSVEISRLYSLPTLVALCFNFYAFLYEIYYFFAPLIIKESYDLIIVLNTITWALFVLYPLSLVTTKVTQITTEVESTGNVVHALLNRTNNQETKAELKQFSIQLLHRRMKFTANGYFTLDNRLIQSLIGTVATYMVILVQFQMGYSAVNCAGNYTQ